MFLQFREQTWWRWLSAVLSANLASAAAVTIMAGLTVQATTLNFDDQPTAPTGISGIALTNQYASLGILFNTIDASQSFKRNIFPTSTPNYASPFFGTTNPGFFIFVDPANPATNMTTPNVTFTLLGLNTNLAAGNYSGATIDALDLAGNVIPGQSVTIPGTNVTTANQVLTFTGPIHEIRFTQTAGTSGLFPFDDLIFGVPEPSTAALAAIGLLFAVAKRRR